MARKKRKSLREMQREKLKRQRSITRTKPNNLASQRVEKVKVKVEPQKQLRGSGAKRSLPAGKKGGAIKPKVKPQGSVSAQRAIKAAELERAKQGTKGPTRTGQPAGSANRKFGANVVKGATQRALRSGALRTAGKVAGGVGRAAGFVGTAAAGLSTVADLKKQIVDRQEGFGSFGKLAKAIAEDNKKANQGSRGRSQAKKDNDNKPKKESKPSRTTSGGNTNRRGRRITSSSSKPSSSKPRVSNIPKSEGTGKEAETKLGYGAGAKKPPTKPSVTRTAKKKPSIKEAAYAKDSRNREYDRLRKAGKTKEAEALGRKIAGMKPKEVKETQKRTGGSRIANITLPKKEPEKKSAARKAGYQGSRLY